MGGAVLTPNLVKVVHALGLAQSLDKISHQPNRAQVRFGRSAYLLSELPLGRFCSERYGAGLANVDSQALLELLREDLPSAAFNHTQAPIVETAAPSSNTATAATGAQLYHSVLPLVESTANANITWLNEHAIAWQFSTLEQTHFYFYIQQPTAMTPEHWHPSLQAPVQQAKALDLLQQEHTPAENWYQGNIVLAGDAAYAAPAQWREFTHIGLEDAWVLSRMLENYEEEWPQALASYEKYRGARARRITRNLRLTQNSYSRRKPLQRLARNLNIALSTRFLPEIAMQRIDWHYGHDCIRGFR